MGNCFKSSISIIKEIENTDVLSDDEIKIIYDGMDKNRYKNSPRYLDLENIILIVKNIKLKNNAVLIKLKKEDFSYDLHPQNRYHYYFKNNNGIIDVKIFVRYDNGDLKTFLLKGYRPN